MSLGAFVNAEQEAEISAGLLRASYGLIEQEFNFFRQ